MSMKSFVLSVGIEICLAEAQLLAEIADQFQLRHLHAFGDVARLALLGRDRVHPGGALVGKLQLAGVTDPDVLLGLRLAIGAFFFRNIAHEETQLRDGGFKRGRKALSFGA